MRRLFALIVVLAVSGIIPLAASAGVCAATPCCRAHASGEQSIAAPPCCNETNCAPAPQDAQATTQIAKTLVKPPVAVFLPSVLPVTCAMPPVAEPSAHGSPPAQQRRLAALSTLLI
jgi:hypothetical protein